MITVRSVTGRSRSGNLGPGISTSRSGARISPVRKGRTGKGTEPRMLTRVTCHAIRNERAGKASVPRDPRVVE
jgi:hypothetical protein